MASISACAVGSPKAFIRLRSAASTTPFSTTTAPTGASPSAAAASASDSARSMGASGLVIAESSGRYHLRIDVGAVVHAAQTKAEQLEEFLTVFWQVGQSREVFGVEQGPALLELGLHGVGEFPIINADAGGFVQGDL